MDRQHHRAQWHDYSEPRIYMLTLVANERGTPFGRLEQQADGRIVVRRTPLG